MLLFMLYLNSKVIKMEEKTQTQLYSEFLIAKAKRLDIDPEIKEKVIRMLEYLGAQEDRKLYLAQSDQSEFYLQILNSKLYQTVKNYDTWGSTMQKRRDILMVKDIPALYIQYQETIDESISKRRRF